MTDKTTGISGGAVNNPLGYAPIPGLIRRFAIPSVISFLVSAAYNITDQIFIGQVVGMLGNAATNVAFPVTILTNALAQLIGVGAAANFNISMGAKKQDTAAVFVGTGLTLITICGVLLGCAVLLLKTPIVLLCGATANVLPLAESYLSITALGLPVFYFTQAASQLIRADGSPSYFMVSNIAGALINVFLDWLFMYPFGWGIEGAAWATITGQLVSFVIVLAYFPRFKAFKIKFATLRVKFKTTLSIMKLGLSNCINQAMMMVVNVVLNNALTRYGAASVYGGDIPLAAAGVISKLNTIVIAFSVGIALGCQPIFGFNTGAKNYARVKRTYKYALTAILGISILFFLAFQIFPRQIISIFGGGSDIYFEFSERYLRIYLMMVCIYGIQPLSVNYFSATGNARQGVVLSLSRQGFILLPLLIVLPLFFGINGVLWAAPIADTLATALSLLLVIRSFRRITAANGA
jgi:Na+-driven multidrug efflux pump